MLDNADNQNGWRPGQSIEDYHSDRSASSRSQIVDVIELSPLAYYEKTILGNQPERKQTPSQRFGNLAHCAILEGPTFFDRHIVAPKFEGKGSKALKDQWKLDNVGMISVTQQELDDLERMCENVYKHEDAAALLRDGIAEQSGYYTDPQTGLALRFRPDYYVPEKGILVDLKTADSVREEDFSRSIWNYRYDFQMAMYAEGIEILDEEPIRYHAMIVVGKTAPFDVAVYLLDRPSLEVGRRDYRRALDLIKSCTDASKADPNYKWPSYQSNMKFISLPYWAMKGPIV